METHPRGMATYLGVVATHPGAMEVGLGTEFRFEKIPRNRLGAISVIPRKKAFIPRHSKFCWRANSEARNGTESGKKLVLRNSSKITLQNDLSVHQKSPFLTLFLKYSAAAFCSELVSLPRFGSTVRNSELCSHPKKGWEQNCGSAYHTYEYPTPPPRLLHSFNLRVIKRCRLS